MKSPSVVNKDKACIWWFNLERERSHAWCVLDFGVLYADSGTVGSEFPSPSIFFSPEMYRAKTNLVIFNPTADMHPSSCN